MDSSPGPWLADLCAAQGIPVVLGHALSRQAIQGGTATPDPIDAQKIAALLRRGMLPHASVDPAAMRATRDLLRRRTHLRRQRAALLPHVQPTHGPSNLPELGKTLASKANREGVAHRFPELAVQKQSEVDLALLTYDEARLRDLERSIRKTATQHDATPLSRLHTVPGMGKILRLVLRYAIHARDRFPRVQDFVSSGRLLTGAKASAGKRLGTSGQTIGHAHRTWAFSDAAALVLRNNAPGPNSRPRVEKRHDQGPALPILAHTRARAVYNMRQRTTAVDRHIVLHPSGSSAGEPGASPDTSGDKPAWRVRSGLWTCVFAHYGPPRPCLPEPSPVMGHPLWLLERR